MRPRHLGVTNHITGLLIAIYKRIRRSKGRSVFGFTGPPFVPLALYLGGPENLLDERRAQDGDTGGSPSAIGVFNPFSDEQRRKHADRLDDVGHGADGGMRAAEARPGEAVRIGFGDNVGLY